MNGQRLNFGRWLLLFGCLLAVAVGGMAQAFNRPVPPGFPFYEFQGTLPSGDGSLMIAPFRNFSPVPQAPYAALLDSAGYIRWYKKLNGALAFDFKFHQPSGWMSYCETDNRGENGFRTFLDSNFQVMDTMFAAPGRNLDYHECIQLSNGNWLRVSFPDSIMDLSAYNFGGTPGDPMTNVVGWELEELDSNGSRVWHWLSYDHLSFSEWNPDFGYNPTHWRYCQGNSAFELPSGNLLVSFRPFNAVMEIDRTSGQVLWRLGGNQSDFNLVNDNGFSGQHTALLSPNNEITIFDNHNSSSSPQITRMVAFTLDSATMNAQRVWEYLYPDTIFASAMGSFEFLPSGEGLINWGNVQSPDPMVTLIDNSDQIQAELYFENGIVNYRSYWQELPFGIPQPEINCATGSSVTLTAPSGFGNYLWSTGDTTRSISVSGPGTWQCYMPFGVGYIASIPFTISDWSNPCGSISILPENPAEPPRLLGKWDLWGRPVDRPLPGQIVILRYDNGSWKKQIITGSH